MFQREYTDDCVFNETLEQHNYNTYSSAKWSTARKTLYLGLNRRGQPRRVQAKGHNLGRLSAYARVLTQVAPSERVEALQRRLLGAEHNVRHRHNSHRGDLIQQSLCPSLPVQEKDGRDKFRCRKRKKRKKRKRRCRPGEKPGPQCQTTTDEKATGATAPARNEGLASNGTRLESKRSCEGAASDEACRREALSVPSKKRKLRVEQTVAEDGGGDGGGGGGRGRNVTKNVSGGARNVVAASTNGERKTSASSKPAKKVNAAGSMSQSKKPNLTDGKKRKKKGPAAAAAAARRNSTVPLARKRFTVPGGSGAGITSAVPTTTTVASTFVTSSSSWSSPGTSTAPWGKRVSPRRAASPSTLVFPSSTERAPLVRTTAYPARSKRHRRFTIARSIVYSRCRVSCESYERTNFGDRESSSDRILTILRLILTDSYQIESVFPRGTSSKYIGIKSIAESWWSGPIRPRLE